MKKFLSLLLVLVTCLTLAVPALAADVIEIEDAQTDWNDDYNALTPISMKVGDKTVTTPNGYTIELSNPVTAVKSNFVFAFKDFDRDYRLHYAGECYVVPDRTAVTIKDPAGKTVKLDDIMVDFPLWYRQPFQGGTIGGDWSPYLNLNEVYMRLLFGVFTDPNDYTGNSHGVVGHSSITYDEYICLMPQSAVKNVISEAAPATPSTPTTPAAPAKTNFKDVPAGAYYEDAVKWAVEKGITTGTSATTFSPEQTCTQGQILTFLWRANGSPEPKSAPDYTDYYAKACQWAKEQEIVYGIGTPSFSPNANCVRAMAVQSLWRDAGRPQPSAVRRFSDVSYNTDMETYVSWAVEAGVTTGTSEKTFSPLESCTRGQIVTFLYRYFNK